MAERAIEVRPVRGRRDIERFIRVPFRVYEGDPNWVPLMFFYARQLLSRRKNAFFDHGEAELWIAWRDGEPVGRVSAQINTLHLDIHKDATGHFGFFEAIDDQAVFAALLETAEAWLRARGMKRVVGPYSFSINEEIGVLVEGFGDPPMVGMSHSPRYYAERLERAGYRKAKDVFAFLLDREALMGGKLGEMRKLLDRPQDDARLAVREMNMRRFAEEMREGIDIYNDAWNDNWGFVPVTRREVESMIRSVRAMVRPEYALFGEVDGRRVAMLMAVPNLNELLHDARGRLLPLGLYRLVRAYLTKQCGSARVGIMGVRREFRDSRIGMTLIARMIARFAEVAAKRDLKRGELSWVLEDNRASIGICQLVGGRRYKTYRIFQKAL
jgi:hypothetical protein